MHAPTNAETKRAALANAETKRASFVQLKSGQHQKTLRMQAPIDAKTKRAIMRIWAQVQASQQARVPATFPLLPATSLCQLARVTKVIVLST
mmetsp:Transcript_30667/g.55139  ORF Transcript_30667/g.55139 Transcript_30667/m.55139 type:complete len:92 (-) Transcript_30667:1598-1873(-)